MLKGLFLQYDQKIDRQTRIIMYLVLFLLVSAIPYIFCRIFPSPPASLLSMAFFMLFVFVCMLQRRLSSDVNGLFAIVSFQCCIWVLFAICHGDSSYITRIMYLITSFVAISCLCNREKGLILFLKFYNNFILVMAICGAIAFVLSIVGLLSPIFEYENVDGRTGYCLGLTCTNAIFGNIIRYSGFFDEPGAMAFWGVFALIFNRLFFKNTKYEVALIVCLLFTFSMAFYIQLVFYILFFYVNLKKVKNVFLISLLLAIIGGGIYLTKDTEFDLYKYTFGRFEVDSSTGKFVGDNRSDLMESAKVEFLKAPWLGVGAQNIEKRELYIADNPYETLANDGIIGTFNIYLPLLVIMLYGLRRNKNIFYGALILAMGYLQRPFHVNIIHPMMLYMLFVMTMNNKKYNNRQI